MGFQFDFKKAWMLLFFLVIPFVFCSFRSIKQYDYYMNEQPSYQSLITVHGRIIADNRAPPEPYNKRHDGIYIQTNNGNINVKIQYQLNQRLNNKQNEKIQNQH